jgi:glycerophosphoryl diester phosphodiesterase
MKMKSFVISFILILTGMAGLAQSGFDLQGHRGCRGIMPENTIPAFIKALEIGVTTLELDVVITKDHQVVVSHEPYMNYATCLDSLGKPFTKERQTDFKLYGMTMSQIRKFDCGSLYYPDFPDQVKIKVTKPLLSEMIDAA